MPDDIAKELQASFPFNRGNLVAWKEYKRQIKILWGGNVLRCVKQNIAEIQVQATAIPVYHADTGSDIPCVTLTTHSALIAIEGRGEHSFTLHLKSLSSTLLKRNT